MSGFGSLEMISSNLIFNKIHKKSISRLDSLAKHLKVSVAEIEECIDLDDNIRYKKSQKN